MEGHTSISNLRQLRRAAPSLRLPEYQRGIVWTENQVLALIDSAERGFPIGVLMLWEADDGQTYVIDGQQRFTALTGRRPGEATNTWGVHFDIDAQLWTLREPDRGIPLWVDDFSTEMDLWRGIGGVEDPKIGEAVRRRDAVQQCWNFPTYLLRRATPLDVVDVFLRMNCGGTPPDPTFLDWVRSNFVRREAPKDRIE